ncbi:MAG TPA: hypothetical protein VMS30_01410 [Phycisphaerales bacterium]|nr:hypothetical protein [Phycisphaerales bacterium]
MRRLCTFNLMILLASLWLCGCGVSNSVVATENDRLRAQVMELEKQVKTLESRNSELQTQIEAQARVPSSIPREIAENTPHVTGVSINRLSQARDSDGDGRLDSIILYLEPADGLGRFLQIVGSVSMHAAILPPNGPAKTIGQKTLGPAELRDAYRSAFTGQYYSLILPIEPPPAPAAPRLPPATGATTAPAIAPVSDPAGQCTVRIEYVDGYTGQRFAAERVIDLR